MCTTIDVTPKEDGDGFAVKFGWGDGMMENIPIAEAKTAEEANNLARACRAMHNALINRISGTVNTGLNVNYLPIPTT